MASQPPRQLSQPIFYYDLGSPVCYLVAERIMGDLPVVPEWEPVLGATIEPPAGIADRELIEDWGSELGLQRFRWPLSWPPETRRAMLAATYAKRVGRAVAFSLAAFRQAFAAGRDLGEEETVLIAAAACEMHPKAVLKGILLRSVAEALEGASARASRSGVKALPAIEVSGAIFEGPAAIELAASALESHR